MASNIDLTSPEVAEKKFLTGKSALIFSVLLLVIVFAIFLVLTFLKSKYSADDKVITDQISQEQSKVNGATFSDIIDFQERLDSAGKIIDDHGYWDSMTQRMSGYVIPEVKLTKFSGKKDATGAGMIDISGIAQNLDSLSRELILLKDFPNLDSLEFKNAGESQGQSGGVGGVNFDASLKVNKSAFQK
jgi:hypothetical protein